MVFFFSFDRIKNVQKMQNFKIAVKSYGSWFPQKKTFNGTSFSSNYQTSQQPVKTDCCKKLQNWFPQKNTFTGTSFSSYCQTFKHTVKTDKILLKSNRFSFSCHLSKCPQTEIIMFWRKHINDLSINKKKLLLIVASGYICPLSPWKLSLLEFLTFFPKARSSKVIFMEKNKKRSIFTLTFNVIAETIF